MKDTRQHRSGSLCRIVTAVFALTFLSSIISTVTAFAATNLFKIQSAELSELSSTADGSISSFDETSIVSNVSFRKLGDSAKFTITLRNTDSKDHVIQSIADDNENPYISYEYYQHANEKISAGSDFVFVVTAKYSSSVTDANQRTLINNVKFLVQFTDIEAMVLMVPNTGKNSNIGSLGHTDILPLAISVTGLTIVGVIALKKHKKANKCIIVGIVTVAAIATVATVRAENFELNSFTINTSYELGDKVAVTYVVNGDPETELVDYGSKVNKELSDKSGYKNNGWVLEDGSKFDTNTEIIEDTTLIANYEPISYTVVFNGNSARKGEMAPQIFTYDEAQNLSTNLFKKHGYGLDKWTTTENGEGGQSFTNEQEVNNLTTEDGATINLYAQWKTMPCNPNATHFDDTVCLQDINAMTIKTMPYDEQYQLRDSRDGRYYPVMRLIDGNIWMQEDLFIMDKTISSADSNLPEGVTFTIPASDISAFTDDAYHPAAYDNGEYGVLYNFYTATAGWLTVESDGPSPMDICPKGWHIPSSEEATLLPDLYGWDDELVSEKYRPHGGGTIYDGELDWGGDDWSYGDAWLNYALIQRPYNSDKIYPYYAGSAYREGEADGSAYYWPGGSISNRTDGLYIRCVSNKPTMQTFNKDTNAYTINEIGDSAYLEDTRYSVSYEVKKLADGNVWMVDNLQSFNSIPLTNEHSNVPEGESHTTGGHFGNPIFFTLSLNDPGYSDLVSYYDYNQQDYEKNGAYFNFNYVTLGWGKTNTTSGNSPRDICPRGWRLPTSSELTALSNSYNSPSDFILDAKINLIGHVANGVMEGEGELLDLWSSDMNSDGKGISLTISNDTEPTLTTSHVIVDGKNVRCIAK